MDNSKAVQNRRVFTIFLLDFSFCIFSREIAMDSSQAVWNRRVFTNFLHATFFSYF